jgi:hypothetical protein
MRSLLRGGKPLIGMIHVGALPGTPRSLDSPDTLARRAADEARSYRDAGIDALAIENMHDRPYLNRHVGPEVVAAMTRVADAVKAAAGIPCGIQILAGANAEALAVARAAGLDFVRVEGFVFSHVADEGLMQGMAGELLRYRRSIGADDVLVLADVKKKHASHAITADVDIAETARAAELFLADGVVVTGARTGSPALLDDLAAVKRATGVPVLVGSGITRGNVGEYLELADGLIVGSALKRGGDWAEPVDPERVRELVVQVQRLRR